MVHKLDRAFRNMREFLNMPHEWKEQDVTLYIVNFHGMTIDLNSSGGRMMFHVFAALAEFERDIITERTKEALRERKRKGIPSNQYAGYGKVYVKDPKTKKRVAVDNPDELKLMSKLYELRMKNYSWNQLRQIVNYQWKLTSKRGKPYSETTIYRLVHAEAKRRGVKPDYQFGKRSN